MLTVGQDYVAQEITIRKTANKMRELRNPVPSVWNHQQLTKKITLYNYFGQKAITQLYQVHQSYVLSAHAALLQQ